MAVNPHGNSGDPKRDEWATPPEFYAAIHRRFQPDLDVCASAENTKCAAWIDKRQDGLRTTWAKCANGRKVSTTWCNPGFSNVRPWLARLCEQSSLHGIRCLVLTHADHSTDWFRMYYKLVSQIWLLTPRIHFIAPTGIKSSNNSKPNYLWVFDGLKSHNKPTQMLPFDWKNNTFL